ncbi:MAG: endonuclease III [Gemmatimonadaceae bacterium]|nr:endonuclease III [Gemmatimonadaceae bacterium]
MKRQPAASPAPRRRRSAADLLEHAHEIVRRLRKEYPNAHCELDFKSPFQLLVATILSAQCTDKRVNMVTPGLFATCPTPKKMVEASPEDLEEIIKSTGFFRAKTKSLQGMSSGLLEQHGGKVPDTMDDLVALRGVGRKTANVVLGNAFGKDEGIVVDTHVGRVSVRLALTNETDPVRVEEKLMALVPRPDWTIFSHLLIFHGRRVCVARLPKCGVCVLNDICPSRRTAIGDR